MKNFLAYLLGLLIFETQVFAQNSGSILLNFEHFVGNSPMKLASEHYRNSLGEKYQITTFKYFVSNVILTKADGTNWKAENQYFLIDESDRLSKSITLQNVPVGQYSSLSFTLGVDSVKSVDNIANRKGVLDIAKTDMYWSWNSGYVFLKLEGFSMASIQPQNHFQYHIGGFGGYSGETTNNIKQITLKIHNNGLKIMGDKKAIISVKVNSDKVFGRKISIKNISDIATPKQGKIMADHYIKMFSIGQIEYQK